jgi:hypothetical protein
MNSTQLEVRTHAISFHAFRLSTLSDFPRKDLMRGETRSGERRAAQSGRSRSGRGQGCALRGQD